MKIEDLKKKQKALSRFPILSEILQEREELCQYIYNPKILNELCSDSVKIIFFGRMFYSIGFERPEYVGRETLSYLFVDGGFIQNTSMISGLTFDSNGIRAPYQQLANYVFVPEIYISADYFAIDHGSISA